MSKEYVAVTLKERPDLKDDFSKLHSLGWVKIMREDPISIKYWDKLLSWFSEFQFILLDNTGIQLLVAILFLFIGMVQKIACHLDGMVCLNREY